MAGARRSAVLRGQRGVIAHRPGHADQVALRRRRVDLPNRVHGKSAGCGMAGISVRAKGNLRFETPARRRPGRRLRRLVGRLTRSAAGAGRPEQHRHAPGKIAAAGRRRPRPGPGPRAGHHRPGSGPSSNLRTGQRHGHPVGTPRRRAPALLGGHYTRGSRHRHEGADRRRPADRGAAGPRPARQRRPGSARRGGNPATEERNRQRTPGGHQPGHQRPPGTPPPHGTWQPGWLPNTTATSLSTNSSR